MSATSEKNGLAILVVDGDVLVRLTIAEYLRDCGFTVLEAASGEEALVVLQADRPVDVVFSEIELPGPTDGFTLSAWVRQHRPATKMILTGTVKRAAHTAAGLCNDDGPLPKPYEPQIVLERIRRLTGRAGE